jgi:hypothetical protein
MLILHNIIFSTLMVRYSSGEQEMDKDTLTRNLKLVWRIVVGISVLLPPEQVHGPIIGSISVSSNRLFFKWVFRPDYTGLKLQGCGPCGSGFA